MGKLPGNFLFVYFFTFYLHSIPRPAQDSRIGRSRRRKVSNLPNVFETLKKNPHTLNS